MTRVQPAIFPGPSGRLEGIWKEASGPARGSAVFAHPHPLYGGTMHNRVVFRAARVLTTAGWSTLRFNFRGVGLSDGRYDAGRGESDDYRAALDEAERRGGTPLLAGGFSFGAAAALRAIQGDPRVAAYVAVGLPVATESFAATPRPSVPALFVVGERDVYGPPDRLADFVSDSGRIAVVPGADHFLDGNLEQLDTAIPEFLASLPSTTPRR